MNKVKVIKGFPGFYINDVLTLNSSTGLFEYSYNDNEKSNEEFLNGVKSAFNELTKYKPSLSKEQVSKGIPEYLEDISEYKMKDQEWLENRLKEIQSYIDKIDTEDKDGMLPDTVNVKEAKTVWQNLIWEIEVILGKRNHYRSDL